MADPITLSALALSAGSGFSGIMAAKSQAQQQIDQLHQNIVAHFSENQRQQYEADRALEDKRSERVQQADREIASLRAQDSGTGLSTIERQVMEIGFFEGTDLARLSHTADEQAGAYTAQNKATAQGYENAASNAKSAYSQAVTGHIVKFAQTGLQISRGAYELSAAENRQDERALRLRTGLGPVSVGTKRREKYPA